MNPRAVIERLAVCTWSLQPTDPQNLTAKLLATGLNRVQLALDPLLTSPKVWGETESLLQKNGIRIVSGMVGCVGENYSTLDSIRLTGGIAPDATWPQNQANFRAAAVLAKKLGLKLVTFHAGFVPPDESDPMFAKMLLRLKNVADVFEGEGIILGLETGQETAAGLAHLLQTLDHPGLGVNFDPANMILYDKGDPVEALGILARWIRQVHIKDAKRTLTPGTWGQEVAAGTGEVNWHAFFKALDHARLNVNLVIEREAGEKRVDDIRTAAAMVTKLLG